MHKIFHTIWYGPSEVESYERAKACLKRVYGLDRLHIKRQEQFSGSNYHVEIDLATFPMNQIYDWIEEFASTGHVNCMTKLVILRHFDLLPLTTQQTFRMLMEDRSVRLYITALWIDKVDDAIQSRCVCIRVAQPLPPQSAELTRIAAQPPTRASVGKWLTHCDANLYLKYRFRSYAVSPENLRGIFETMLYYPKDNEAAFLHAIP